MTAGGGGRRSASERGRQAGAAGARRRLAAGSAGGRGGGGQLERDKRSAPANPTIAALFNRRLRETRPLPHFFGIDFYKPALFRTFWLVSRPKSAAACRFVQNEIQKLLQTIDLSRTEAKNCCKRRVCNQKAKRMSDLQHRFARRQTSIAISTSSRWIPTRMSDLQQRFSRRRTVAAFPTNNGPPPPADVEFAASVPPQANECCISDTWSRSRRADVGFAASICPARNRCCDFDIQRPFCPWMLDASRPLLYMDPLQRP